MNIEHQVLELLGLTVGLIEYERNQLQCRVKLSPVWLAQYVLKC